MVRNQGITAQIGNGWIMVESGGRRKRRRRTGGRNGNGD